VRTTTITVLLLSLPAAVYAHPGHGSPGNPWGLLHYLAEPLHLGSGIIVAVAVLLAALRWSHRNRGRSS
jgi:hydrogenase/urease accessory protein HupE